jgi:hypothetical protein
MPQIDQWLCSPATENMGKLGEMAAPAGLYAGKIATERR